MGPRGHTIPRHVTVQHIKGIASVPDDSVSRLRIVGLHHDLDSEDHQQEFSLPFEPLPPLEQTTHMPIQVNEIFVAPDIEKLVTHYITYQLYRWTKPTCS